ncbi:DNA-methyltransferase [Burkholderia anthina]|uniref:DNA-methyltransferase n=1 Tax=Burkholderia anthina TaxID=179879 RepID=UPI001AA07C15|nr:DNA methyltransferase [Burkholderia anthina]QTD88777.1 site-specific DNA-methyltransferase [Burkholderia anthina]
MTTPYSLHIGDCRTVLKTIADASIDAIVTDPPYELGFMGRDWDRSGVANDVSVWTECLRVLKPGGHLLAFSGSRTYHRMACAIEDAGFELRDQIMWLYGSGFPKSLDVSKAIDKALGVEGSYGAPKSAAHAGWIDRGRMRGADGDDGWQRPWMADEAAVDKAARKYEGASDAARQWQGWGTALKPAHEPICVARKPIVGTVAANVLAHSTGALNIDACRVPVEDADYARNCSGDRGNAGTRGADQEGATNLHAGGGSAASGRWPANVIHDGSDEVLAAFPDAPGQIARASSSSSRKTQNVYGSMARGSGGAMPRTEFNESAARFFYCAKATRADRNEGVGCSDAPAVETNATMRQLESADWPARNGNHHPTVKPTELMAYLCRLVTPPGGLVLDPFMGSGSTGKAAMREGFRFIGIDLTPEYVEIARARIEYEIDRVASELRDAEDGRRQADLFGDAA